MDANISPDYKHLLEYFHNRYAYYEYIDEEQLKSIHLSPLTNSANQISFEVPLYGVSSSGCFRIRESSRELTQLFEEATWMKGFFDSATELKDVKSLVPYYKEINSILSRKKFDQCDLFLSQVQTNSISDVLLVGLLRLTFSYRDYLPSWDVLLLEAKEELLNRGYRPEDTLKGLL